MPTSILIHFIWFGIDSPTPFTNFKYKKCIGTFQKYENYNIRIWSKTDCEQLVQEHFPIYDELYHSLPLDIMRIDMVRYMIMYVHGGFYFDCDVVLKNNLLYICSDHTPCLFFTELHITSEYNKKLIETESIRCGVPEDEQRIANYAFYSIKECQIWLFILEEIKYRYLHAKTMNLIENIRPYNVLYITGPDVVTHVAHRWNNVKLILDKRCSDFYITHIRTGFWREPHINK